MRLADADRVNVTTFDAAGQGTTSTNFVVGMDEDRIQVFSDYQQVLDRMGGALEKHDVVLVKGSRFVELDRFVEGVC